MPTKKQLVEALAQQFKMLNVNQLYQLPKHRTTKDWIADTSAILKNLDQMDYEKFNEMSKNITPMQHDREIRKRSAHEIESFIRQKVAEFKYYDFKEKEGGSTGVEDVENGHLSSSPLIQNIFHGPVDHVAQAGDQKIKNTEDGRGDHLSVFVITILGGLIVAYLTYRFNWL